jgi:hypothetical protein
MTDFRPTTLSPEALKAWDEAEANIEASMQRIKELTDRSDPEEKTTLTLAQLKECMSAFYEWFCEPEGFSYREERFWDACERKDDKELLTWLKTAWHMGYEQCLLEKVNEPI